MMRCEASPTLSPPPLLFSLLYHLDHDNDGAVNDDDSDCDKMIIS